MTQSLQNHTHSPLIGIIFEENGQEVVRYFTEEKATDAAVSESATQKALGVIGTWSDLDGMRRWQHLIASGTRASQPHPSSYEALFTGYCTACRTASCPSCRG